MEDSEAVLADFIFSYVNASMPKMRWVKKLIPE